MTKATNKIKLNIGCGIVLKAGYINVDGFIDEKKLRAKEGPYKNAIIQRGAKFVKAMAQKLPFEDNYADYILFSHTIEHLPMNEVVPTLKELRRVLKPGGILHIDTNDMVGICAEFLERASEDYDPKRYRDMEEVFYGNQKGKGEYHLSGFSHEHLNWCLTQAGFKKGKIGKIKPLTQFPEIVTKDKKEATGKVARNAMLWVEVEK